MINIIDAKKISIPPSAGALDATVNYWCTRIAYDIRNENERFKPEYNLAHSAGEAMEDLVYAAAPTEEIAKDAIECCGVDAMLKIAHIVQMDPFGDPRQGIRSVVADAIENRVSSGDYDIPDKPAA